jgi:colanic acid biosynthesis glycosyl transferase WcaI
MHVILMAQHFAPEDVSGAVLATELAGDLVARGHTVTFVTCAPSYPKGQVFEGYRNRLLQIEQLDGVRVVRTWSYITLHKSFWRRMLNYSTFSAFSFFGGLVSGKPDVIFSYSPPLPLGISAWMLSLVWNVPWILRVEDIYPDAAVAAAVLRNAAAIRFFKWLERFLYRRADHISLISEGFRRNLEGKGIVGDKISVTPVWADPDTVRPMTKDNAFRKEHNLGGTFVVLYAGALGHTSALEDVLDTADLLQGASKDSAAQASDLPPVRFVIVGEGVKKEALIQAAQQRGLCTVSFLPFQPRERFSEMLAAADASLVTLNSRSATFSLPGKTFNLMASARPILAVTPSDSEIAALVMAADCGVNVPPGNPEQLAQVIRTWQRDASLPDQLGRNGRAMLESHFSRSHCVGSFARIMAQVANERHHPAGGQA